MINFNSLSRSTPRDVTLWHLEKSPPEECTFGEPMAILLRTYDFHLFNGADEKIAADPYWRYIIFSPPEFCQRISQINEFDLANPKNESMDLYQVSGKYPEFFKRFFFLQSHSFPPIWRSISRGLNFEVRCSENQCPVANQWVWTQLGYGEFEIADLFFNNAFLCPLCKTSSEEIGSVGFFQCRYVIHGRTVEPKKVINVNLVAKVELSVYPAKNVAKWTDLTITTKPLS